MHEVINMESNKNLSKHLRQNPDRTANFFAKYPARGARTLTPQFKAGLIINKE